MKHRLQVLKETRDLQKLPTLKCAAEVLLPVQRVKLGEIFGSCEIEAEWKTAAGIFQRLEIPDGIGGVNPGDRRAVFYLVRYFKPCSILEIGTHVGASTAYMAAALLQALNDRDPRTTPLVSVDITNVNDPMSGPWVRYGLKRSPRETVNMMGCGDLVEFVTKSSLDHLTHSERKYDFIFLDGDHAATTVYREIPAALALLNRNGLILLHDYFPELKALWSDGIVIPGPFLATELLKTHGAQVQAVPLGVLPWRTKLDSNVTSLALLARSSS